jgi:hypothetical protein
MKYLTFLFLSSLLLFGHINPRFTNPTNCNACHPEHVREWETSWHARSHETKNSLYQAAITHVQKSTHKTRADVAIDCAKCHNPRLDAQKPDETYMYAKAFGLEVEATQKVEEALNAKHAQSGIGCYVCHNVDTLHSPTTPKQAGTDLITWTKGDVVVGPFPANSRSPFHESQQRDFFLQGNQLCLTCHEGNANQHTALPGYETGSELLVAGAKERCVDCHMGTPRKQIIAPHILREGEPVLVRDIRSHQFSGARNSDILSTTLNLFAETRPKEAVVRIQNLTPHRAPTGFGGRSMVLKVDFFANETLVKTYTVDFRAIYLSATGEETLSYVAAHLKSDTRLKPYEIQTLLFPRPENATKVEAQIVYYVLAPALQPLLEISDPIFTKPYPVAKASAFFK